MTTQAKKISWDSNHFDIHFCLGNDITVDISSLWYQSDICEIYSQLVYPFDWCILWILKVQVSWWVYSGLQKNSNSNTFVGLTSQRVYFVELGLPYKNQDKFGFKSKIMPLRLYLNIFGLTFSPGNLHFQNRNRMLACMKWSSTGNVSHLWHKGNSSIFIFDTEKME